MKTKYKVLTLIAGFCLVLTSCIKEDYNGVDCPGKAYVTFSLNIRNSEPQTRTTWGDDYDQADFHSDYDNYVDLANLQVFFFDLTGAYKGKMEELFYSNSGSNQYLIGSAPSSLTVGTYKIVILANCNEVSLDSNSTLSDLADVTFELYNSGNANAIYIPMWGVTTAALTLEAGKRQDLGTIDLLRSMARVIVYLDKNVYLSGDTVKFADRYNIKSVSLSKYNTTGRVVPGGYLSAANTTDIEIDTTDTFNDTTSLASTTLTVSGTNLMNYASGDSAVFYLPEISNAKDSSVRISVTLAGKNYSDRDTVYTYEDALIFREDNKACNIVRNHSYEFKIQNAYLGLLTATCDVLPWDLEEEDISIDDSFVINEGGYLNFTVPTGVTRTEASDGLTFTFPQTNPDDVVLPFSFKIDGPTNSYWEASIVNSSNTVDYFVFCDEDGNELTDGTVGDGTVSINVTNTFRAGKIDGVSNTLYVKCTQQTPGSDEYSATLNFYLYNPTTQTTYIIQNMVDNTGVEKTVTFKLDPAS